MVARTLFLIAITALVLVGFIWLAPLDVVLSARSYTPEQIATVKQAIALADTPAASGNAKPTTANEPASTPAAAEPETAANNQQEVAAPDQTTTPATPAATQPAPARKFVATDTINVRAGQGTDTDVVGQLEPKTVVTVLQDPEGDWMQIEAEAITGWVYKPLFERQQ